MSGTVVVAPVRLRHNGQVSNEPTLVKLSVELVGAEPAIWRTIDVDADLPLPRFHQVLQSAMGWTESHLHAFADRSPFESSKRGLSLVPRRWLDSDSIDEGLEGFDEAGETVGGALGHGASHLWYEYDFGDGWVHAIREVSRRPRETDDPEALVLEGKRRAPLEDCGGIGGWQELLRLWSGPTGDPEMDDGREDLLAWIEGMQGFGRIFDPDDFDVDAANADLRLTLDQALRGAGDAHDDGAQPDLGTAGPDPQLESRHRAGRWIAGLDEWCRHEFGVALHRAGIDPLGRPVVPPLPLDGEEAVAPYQWLIRACGTSGLDLTTTGNLSQKNVLRALGELHWQDHETVYGSGKTEANAGIVAVLRTSAIGAGLVRKSGRKLQATVAGRKLADRPVQLWQRLVERAIPTRSSAIQIDAGMLELLLLAGGTPGGRDEFLPGASNAVQKGIRQGMSMRGYVRSDGLPLSQTWFIGYVEQLADTQQVIGSFTLADAEGGRPDPVRVAARRGILQRTFASAVLQA